MKSYFVFDMFDVHTNVGGHVDLSGDLSRNFWVVSVPGKDERVCDTYRSDLIPMYEIIFWEMGFRVPFTDFHISFFNYL